MTKLATVVVTVVALLGVGLMTPAEAGNAHLGKLSAGNKVLEKGCHAYRYKYVVRARASEWTLEVFLKDPTGETIASNTKDSSADPKRGHAKFRFCRYNTRPGKFTIKGKLTRYNGYDSKTGWVKQGSFRMRLA